MATVVNQFFEERVEQLFNLAAVADQIFAAAGVDYQIVGGLAVYLYVEEAEPDAGRLTKDIDIAVRREDLQKIAAAAEQFGFVLRHTAGIDMLVRKDQPSARRAVHLVFAGEKVRPEYLAATPEIGAGGQRRVRGFRLTPLADLVRMKLTSFRAKDEAHINDMDEAGLITPALEASLPNELRERLRHARGRNR